MNSTFNTLDEYALSVGQVIVNLQSLELVLRLFLCEANGEKVGFPAGSGESVPETHLTNYETLRILIEKFNRQLTAGEASRFGLDAKVVSIRDAFAHGRILDQSPLAVTSSAMHLFKFAKPKAGIVELQFDCVLSPEWLRETRVLLYEQLCRVSRCAENRSYKTIQALGPLL